MYHMNIVKEIASSFFSLSHEHWAKGSVSSIWIYVLQQQMGFKGLVVLNIFILKYMLDLICF